MGLCEGFLFGSLGGLLPEFYAFYNMRHEYHAKKPPYVASRFYWILTTIMVFFGGGAVVLYLLSGNSISATLAIHVGAATPTMIGTFINTKPKLN